MVLCLTQRQIRRQRLFVGGAAVASNDGVDKFTNGPVVFDIAGIIDRCILKPDEHVNMRPSAMLELDTKVMTLDVIAVELSLR